MQRTNHEVTLVQLTFDFYLIEDKPKNLIGDKAYDSDPLDEELKKEGVEMIAPHRQNRTKKKTQGRTPIASLCAALDGGEILRLASMAASSDHSLGIVSGEFSWLRPTCLHPDFA